MQEPTIINVFNNSQGGDTIDLTSPFNLDRIKAEYITLSKGSSKQFTVPAKRNHFFYLINGSGQLETSGHKLSLAKDDCFSVAESDKERVYTLVAAAEGDSINVLVIQDVNDRASAKKKEHGDEPPTIISASGSSKWSGKGINTAKTGRLGLLTDMGLELERIPWSLNLERLLPGTQSSNTHAHSSEDEFVLVLSGKARYWHQGMTPEPILKAGDCVGWKAGTGICHSLLNDGEDENGAGEDVVFLVWGEDDPDGDKVHYATAHPHWWRPEIRWYDRPEHYQGSASGLPHFPRPEDRVIQ
ncbi:hypothetical protein CPB86DRAFT_745420 [Serendipita vermifera]|nr:hypothetical protein CPB86DRAFT_745420 [Serendipita vermifera]